jgi:hypothetical protein
MDDDFHKDRARQIREVATQADPLNGNVCYVAGNYDAMVKWTRPAVSSDLPELSTAKFTENTES